MQIIKNSIIYLGSSILNRSIPFLLLPIMTQYLSTDEYGLLSIYMILISFYSAFIGMNIHMNVSKNFFKVSKQELSLYIGNIVMILMLSFIFHFLLTLLVLYYVDHFLSIPAMWLIYLPIISMMMMINNINTTILRNEGRAYVFGIFEITNTALNLSITIVFLVFMKYGWYAQIIGILSAYSIFFLISLFYMYKREYLQFVIDTKKIKSILNISVPLIPHVVGGVIIVMSDRLFIEHMIGLEEVGIYSVGYTFGMILMLFTDAFIKSWSPWFYKTLVNPTFLHKLKIRNYTVIYIIAIFILAIVVAYISKLLLPYIVDEKFHEASKYILWVTLGYAMFGVYQIFFPYLVHMSKTSFLALSTSLAAILNLILNYVLIQAFGAIGAAYATFLAYTFMFIAIALYAQKIYPMPWASVKKEVL